MFDVVILMRYACLWVVRTKAKQSMCTVRECTILVGDIADGT